MQMARGVASGYVSFALDRMLEQETIARMEAVAGVSAWPTRVDAPANAASLIDRWLGHLNVGRSLTLGVDSTREVIRDASRAVALLRPFVLEPGFLTPYQVRGVADVITRMPNGSGHLWWSAGSGKTLGGTIWALAG